MRRWLRTDILKARTILAGLLLTLMVAACTGRAEAAAIAAPPTGATASVVNDIPVPPNAQDRVAFTPSAAELRRLLRSLPNGRAGAVRSIRALVFRWPGPVNVQQIMAWYAATDAPPSAPAPPPSSVHGASAPQTGIRPLASDPGYLVVSVAPHPVYARDARVTVVRVEGSPGIVTLLGEVAALITRTVPGRRTLRMAGREDLAFPGSLVEREIMFRASEVPLLLKAISQTQASDAVREMYAAIIRSAEMITLTTYQIARPVSSQEFLRFYREAANRLDWGLVMNDPTPDRPMSVFSLGDGSGIVMVQGESALTLVSRRPNLTQMVPGFRVTVLVVAGKIDLKALRGGKP